MSANAFHDLKAPVVIQKFCIFFETFKISIRAGLPSSAKCKSSTFIGTFVHNLILNKSYFERTRYTIDLLSNGEEDSVVSSELPKYAITMRYKRGFIIKN